MPQDAFHLRRLATELNTFLSGGKVNRITQIDKDEVDFVVYTGAKTVKLVLSTNASNARVCLTNTDKEPLPTPPSFCMLLRKHLQGAKITSIEQVGFERILKICFWCVNDFSQTERVLYCELMGKYSNLILVEKGLILGALKTTSLEENTKRILFSGAEYFFPDPQEKASIFDEEKMREVSLRYGELEEKKADEEERAVFLFDNVSGLALPTAREVVKRIKDVPVYEFLLNFCQNEPCFACLVGEGETPTDFFAFLVDGGKEVASLCLAEDIFYSAKEQKKAFDGAKKKLESAIKAAKKKQEKKLKLTEEKLLESLGAETERKKGELLTANLYKIQKGDSSVEVIDWESGETVKLTLDPTLSPAKNAQRYFKAYTKKRRAQEILLPRKADEEKELLYLETLEFSVRNALCKTDLKEIEEELVSAQILRVQGQKTGKKKTIETPFRRYEKDGFLVLVGRNNLQNDRLLRACAPDDIWLHAQKYHSAHVVIKKDGKKIPDGVIVFAAEICAYFSDGRNADKIPVDYCEKSRVKKPNGAKAGFVVYNEYKTVMVKPTAHEETVE